MRTPLEIRIARLQWKNQETTSISRRKEREFETKIKLARKGFEDEVAQLKKIHEQERRAQARISWEEYNVMLMKPNVMVDEMWKTLQDTLSRAKKTNQDRLTKYNRLKKEHNDLLAELEQLDKPHAGSEMNLQKLHQEIDAYERRLEQEKQTCRDALEESQLQLQRRDKKLHDVKAQLHRCSAALDSSDKAIQRLKERNFDLMEDLGRSRRHELQYRELLEKERERLRHRERTFDLELLNVRKSLDDTIQELMKKMRIEESRRRSLFEQIQELHGAIRVICRIRPDNSHNWMKYEMQNSEFHGDPAKLTVTEEKKAPWGEIRPIRSDTYEFERIFSPRETNHDVFNEIGSFVQSVVDGKKACVFCYGQSGTGKTYTMSNLDKYPGRQEGVSYEHDGIIPRVKTMIFKEKERLEGIDLIMTVRGCCYEIYNNELWLLKLGGREKKTISRNTRSVKDPGLKTFNRPSDFDSMIEVGMKNRHFGTTRLNNNSSRSHFIISIETSVISKDNPEVLREGMLNLVDLAGSERAHQAGTTGAGLQEGNNINTSLSQLGRVFISLSEGRTPTYNGNILTEFLQRSLEKGCMTLMFLMISLLKDNWPATKQTLQFALDAQSARKSKPPGKATKAAPAQPLLSKQPTLAQKQGMRK